MLVNLYYHRKLKRDYIQQKVFIHKTYVLYVVCVLNEKWNSFFFVLFSARNEGLKQKHSSTSKIIFNVKYLQTYMLAYN